MKFGSAIILAGGKSSRMGFDKQLIQKDDKRLVDETIRRLSYLFEDIIVVTHKEELYENDPVRTTPDLLPFTGPLTGIHAGLTLAKSEYAYVMACDMPYINEEYIDVLENHLQEGDGGIVTATNDGWIEPFHAFYHRGILPAIEPYLQLGKRNIRDLAVTENIRFLPEKHVLELDPDKKLFENLNTPKELKNFFQSNR